MRNAQLSEEALAFLDATLGKCPDTWIALHLGQPMRVVRQIRKGRGIGRIRGTYSGWGEAFLAAGGDPAMIQPSPGAPRGSGRTPEIERRLRRGESVTAIAAAVGCSHQNVSQLARRRGIPLSGQKD